MNQERRKQLDEIKAELSAIHERIGVILEAEEEAYNNLNEGLQATRRGCALENSISELENAHDFIDEAISSLGDAAQ